jgi:hypothetical protein
MGYAIWLYWENYYGDRLPDYLELTLETIRRHAGDAPVKVVSPDNLGEYVDRSTLPSGYDDLIPAHKANYLRVRLLHDLGGMWIDIDTVAFKSLGDRKNKLRLRSTSEYGRYVQPQREPRGGHSAAGRFQAPRSACGRVTLDRLLLAP